jgi:glutaryl-CoA dehydrogenase
LDSARYGIAWAIGAAMDCYDTALRYAKERIQFDKPMLEHNKKKLAEMITEITKAQLLTWRLGAKKRRSCYNAQISMAKETM